MRQTPILALCIVVAAYVFHLVQAWPDLPDQLATHFGISGAADGWSSKSSFFMIQALISSAMFVTFLLLPLLLRRLPVSLINLPHKEYWLAEDRAQRTWARISNSMIKMGVATFLFLLMVNREVFYASTMPSPAMSSGFFYVLILYLVYVCWACFALWFQFRRMPAGD